MSFAVAAFNYHHPVALHPVMASAPWTIYHAVVRRFPSQQFESVSLSLCDVKREFEGTGTDVWRGWTPRSHCLCICVYDCILGETVSAVMDSPPGRTITTPLSSWRRQMRMMETTTTTAGWLAPANKTKKKEKPNLKFSQNILFQQGSSGKSSRHHFPLSKQFPCLAAELYDWSPFLGGCLRTSG